MSRSALAIVHLHAEDSLEVCAGDGGLVVEDYDVGQAACLLGHLIDLALADVGGGVRCSSFWGRSGDIAACCLCQFGVFPEDSSARRAPGISAATR